MVALLIAATLALIQILRTFWSLESAGHPLLGSRSVEAPESQTENPLRPNRVLVAAGDAPPAHPLPHRLLYIGVLSAPNHFYQRHRVRYTYLTELREIWKINGTMWGEFLIGHLPFKTSSPRARAISCQVVLEERLEAEARFWGDIYRIPLAESYRRLPDKTFMIYSRGVEMGYQYVLKTDDDWKMKPTYLEGILKGRDHEDLLYSGTHLWKKKVYKIQGNRFGDFSQYFGGRGYMISWGLAWRIAHLNASHSAEFMDYGQSSEDVDSGIWVAQVANATGQKVDYVERFFAVALLSKQPADRTIRVIPFQGLCLSPKTSGSDKKKYHIVAAECSATKNYEKQQMTIDADGRVRSEWKGTSRCFHAQNWGSGQVTYGSCEDDKKKKKTPLRVQHCADGTLRSRSNLNMCLSVAADAWRDKQSRLALKECAPDSGFLQHFEVRNLSDITDKAISKAGVLKAQTGCPKGGVHAVNNISYRPPRYTECPDPIPPRPSNPNLTDTLPGPSPVRQPFSDRVLYIGVLSSLEEREQRSALRAWFAKSPYGTARPKQGRATRGPLAATANSSRVLMEFLVGHRDFKDDNQGGLASSSQWAEEKQIQAEAGNFSDIFRIPHVDKADTQTEKLLLMLQRVVDTGYKFVLVVKPVVQLDLASLETAVSKEDPWQLLFAGDKLCGSPVTTTTSTLAQSRAVFQGAGKATRDRGIRDWIAHLGLVLRRLLREGIRRVAAIRGDVVELGMPAAPSGNPAEPAPGKNRRAAADPGPSSGANGTLRRRCSSSNVGTRFFEFPFLLSWELARQISKVNLLHSAAFQRYGSADPQSNTGHWVARVEELYRQIRPGAVEYVDFDQLRQRAAPVAGRIDDALVRIPSASTRAQSVVTRITSRLPERAKVAKERCMARSCSIVF